MKILSIETSCDETGIAVIKSTNTNNFVLLGNALASQIDLHSKYGGVFPAMAKREHTEKIIPLLCEALQDAHLLHENPHTLTDQEKQLVKDICTKDTLLAEYLIDFLEKYDTPELDYIAFTIGPGLEPALWVGVNTAKSLFAIWSRAHAMQLLPINHMEGHIVTTAFERLEDTTLQNNNNFIGPRVSSPDQKNHHSFEANNSEVVYQIKPIEFPALALLVSGGHTELVVAENFGLYKKIGQTRDDAVGEAFDKVARMLGLEYPGGPKVSKLAKEFRESDMEQKFTMPRPMIHSGDYDFSFSGIKTAMLYKIAELTHDGDQPLTDEERMALACAFEDAAIQVLVKKTLNACDEYQPKSIVVGGGVAGNIYLKAQILKVFVDKFSNMQTLFPEPLLATDNAVMIAMAALLQIQAGTTKDIPLESMRANGNLSL